MAEPKLRLVDGVTKSDSEFDPFDFQKKGYSVDSFFTRSTGPNKEPGEVKYMKFSPTILGAIGTVVSSGVFPELRTDQDFIRDAVVHRLKYLNDKVKSGEVEERVAYHIKLARIEARQLEMAEIASMLATHADTMQMAADTGDVELLLELLNEAEGDMGDLRLVHQNMLNKIIEKYKEVYRRMTA
jgi:hypothetical protein